MTYFCFLISSSLLPSSSFVLFPSSFFVLRSSFFFFAQILTADCRCETAATINECLKGKFCYDGTCNVAAKVDDQEEEEIVDCTASNTNAVSYDCRCSDTSTTNECKGLLSKKYCWTDKSCNGAAKETDEDGDGDDDSSYLDCTASDTNVLMADCRCADASNTNECKTGQYCWQGFVCKDGAKDGDRRRLVQLDDDEERFRKLSTTSPGSVCKSCVAGLSSLPGKTLESDCTACSSGQYSTIGSICQLCVAGKQFVNAVTECTICSKGKYQSSNTAASAQCEDCSVGSYIVDDEKEATEHTSCKTCPKGYEIVVNDVTQPCEICTFSKVRI